MRGPYAFEVLPSYPHLSKNEGEIWSRFVAAFPNYFESVWYDVPLGIPRESPEELKPEYEANRQYLGRYKMDVLGRRSGAPWVVEVKPSATTRALGELWLYEFLYRQDFKYEGPLGLLIVTDELRPNMQDCCREDGVEIVAV